VLHKTFLVLDFGSQVTQLIARSLRELNYYSEIHPYNLSIEKIKEMKPAGIILSGGPSSVYEKDSPVRDMKELLAICPVMGICYGMQLLCHQLGGATMKSDAREYGFNEISWISNPIFKNKKQKVWMSHGDAVKTVAEGCEVLATSANHPAVMLGRNILGVQFHPEVAHTESGDSIFKYFCKEICKTEATWLAPQILEKLSEKVRLQVGPSDHVLVGLSGGVDSSVVATLLTKVLGADRVHCVFVNNGLLRENEYSAVMQQYKEIGLNVKGVDASEKFLSQLQGKSDPEQKRKTIGRVFIEVFEEAIDKKFPIRFLAQGTLYPDVIESVSFSGGPSHTIKSHHNVGGLPEKMNLKLVEPVRELFKDEVRRLGKELGLPKEMLGRHPFPGPGLAIRILGEVTKEALAILRKADQIFIQALKDKGLYDQIWQAACILLPVKTVGVQGDGRTYDQVVALRAVTSSDGMTADWFPFSFEFLRDVSSQITNEVRGINRVVLDITSKPPATIEWE
jgi:GMP synthase (glutamine-hydrolysing)